MKLSAREWTIVFVEFLLAIFLWFLSSRIDITQLSSAVGWILFAGVLVAIVVLVLWIIYKRIGEIDIALEEQEKKTIELEKKLKRAEDLIDIRADIKHLREVCYGKKS